MFWENLNYIIICCFKVLETGTGTSKNEKPQYCIFMKNHVSILCLTNILSN